MLMVWYDEIFALAGMHYHDASAKIIKKLKAEKSYKSFLKRLIFDGFVKI